MSGKQFLSLPLGSKLGFPGTRAQTWYAQMALALAPCHFQGFCHIGKQTVQSPLLLGDVQINGEIIC